MAKQIEYVAVYLIMQRQGDGSYTKTVQEVRACVCDPAATTSPEKDQVCFTPTVAYDGAATVSNFLDTAKDAAEDAAGIA